MKKTLKTPWKVWTGKSSTEMRSGVRWLRNPRRTSIHAAVETALALDPAAAYKVLKAHGSDEEEKKNYEEAKIAVRWSESGMEGLAPANTVRLVPETLAETFKANPCAMKMWW